MLKKTEKIVDDYQVGNLDLATPLIKFLAEKIAGHIKQEDVDFFRWIHEQKIALRGKNIFKICPKCSSKWMTVQEFLSDINIELAGYQANFEHAQLGLFLFNHRKASCHTTIVVRASFFQEYFERQVSFDGFRIEGPNCPKHCEHENVFLKCSKVSCSGHSVRVMLHQIQLKLKSLKRKKTLS